MGARPPTSTGTGTNSLDKAMDWLLIVQRVSLCGRRLRHWLAEQLAPLQLSDTEFLLLVLCSRTQEGLAQNTLASRLGISPARISSLVERLRQRGLIACRATPPDRRRHLWKLTGRGEQLLDESALTLLGQPGLVPASGTLQKAEQVLSWLERWVSAKDAQRDGVPSGKNRAA